MVTIGIKELEFVARTQIEPKGLLCTKFLFTVKFTFFTFG